MSIEIAFVRHAQTDHNRDHKYCGTSDLGLNAIGVSQAQKLRKALADYNFDFIYTSDRKRAVQTAQIAFAQKPLVKFSSLGELNFGRWEGLSADEICQFDHDLYYHWINDPYSCSPRHGESLGALKKRIIGFLERIIGDKNNYHKKIAIVTHAGPIRLVLQYLLEDFTKSFWQIDVNSVDVNYFILNDKKVISHRLIRQ